jgi:hypothetical protein
LPEFTLSYLSLSKWDLIGATMDKTASCKFALAVALRLAGSIILFAVAGCWPFHRSLTPQERYYLAVSRGDAVTAAQIWTRMSPKDRAKLMRGEGVSPKVEQQILRQRLNSYGYASPSPNAATSSAGPVPYSQGPAMGTVVQGR